MENFVPITIAESLSFTAVSVQTSTLLLTAEISLVFGYLAGLRFFLRAEALPIRIFAHFCISVAIIFFWILVAGQFGVYSTFLDYLDMSVQQGVVVPVDSFVLENGRLIVAVSGALLHVLHAAMFFGLFFLTFIFRWGKRVDGR